MPHICVISKKKTSTNDYAQTDLGEATDKLNNRHLKLLGGSVHPLNSTK